MQWKEVKFSYIKTNVEGNDKMVTELYVINAPTFSDAEKDFLEQIMPYVSGEFAIKSISTPRYEEILFSDNDDDDKFYLTNLQYITIDEDTEKEKKVSKYYMVQAEDFDTAKKYVEQELVKPSYNCVIKFIRETSVMDVFENIK